MCCVSELLTMQAEAVLSACSFTLFGIYQVITVIVQLRGVRGCMARHPQCYYYGYDYI